MKLPRREGVRALRGAARTTSESPSLSYPRVFFLSSIVDGMCECFDGCSQAARLSRVRASMPSVLSILQLARSEPGRRRRGTGEANMEMAAYAAYTPAGPKRRRREASLPKADRPAWRVAEADACRAANSSVGTTFLKP